MGCALKTVRQSPRDPRSFCTSRSDVSHRYGTGRGDRTSTSNRHLRRVHYIPNIPLMLKLNEIFLQCKFREGVEGNAVGNHRVGSGREELRDLEDRAGDLRVKL